MTILAIAAGGAPGSVWRYLTAFLETVNEMVQDGLATLERVRVVFYRHGAGGKR